MPRNIDAQQHESKRTRQKLSRSVDTRAQRRGDKAKGVSVEDDWALWIQSVVPTVRFAACCLLVLYACAFGFAFLAGRFDGLMYPNTYVGPYNIGGYSLQSAGAFLQERFNEFQTQGVVVRANDSMVRVHGSVSAVQDPDLSYELYAVDVEATINRLFAVTRSGSRVARGIQIISQLLYPKQYPLVTRVNEDRVMSVLRENFARLEQPPQQPTITVFEDLKHKRRYAALSRKEMEPGRTFAYRDALDDIIRRVALLSSEDVVLRPVIDEPDISQALFDAEYDHTLLRLNAVVSGPELVLATSTATGSARYVVPHSDLMSLLELRANTSSDAGKERIVFAAREDIHSLMEPLERMFGVEPRDAKFVVEQGRVVEFQSARVGIRVSKKSVVKSIETFVNTEHDRSLPKIIEVEFVEPSVQTSDVNDLGIKEIIGIGRSNFSGSPPNRRHNINIGAQALNGTLIPPGEEFSLLQTLGEISGKTGYLPELVIKGDRTVLEYGGGLCQIGTTTFRGALDSGLPITARTNHSYRVSYYEPAGTDATIYNPSPDFRFYNDTGHHILIQTRIEGDEAVFEFWGTRDGRKVHQTKPNIYNIVAPPETKYIETTDLQPGEERCTERAHAGADAEFTYTVTYPNGTINERVFKSRYRPWQAVCLKGVASLSTTTTNVLP